MNRKSLKLVVSFILAMIVSCDEPETVVTNFVHPDGSVTRKIEMKNRENKFELSKLQVPFDSTWTVKDSIELDEKGDTTWIKRAEKLFKNADEINMIYRTDSGANKGIPRRAEFNKRFRWFNTVYKFAEVIDKTMSYGYPVAEFLNEEEQRWFFSPESITNEKLNGPDSLKYRAFKDTISHKSDLWVTKNIVSEWIGEFGNLTSGTAGDDMTVESLKKREDEFVKIMEINNEKFDSLWSNGILLKEFIGEANSLKYKTEADSAIEIVTKRLFIDFKSYSLRIVMPGEIIGSNGFIDTNKIMMWSVNSDYFMTEPYIMWAESKLPNIWAWIVSGLFLLFVSAGIIFRIMKKG